MTLPPLVDPEGHRWVRPANADCPDCPCCTTALCKLASVHMVRCNQFIKDTAGVMDTSACPCTADAVERRREHLRVDEPLVALTDDELADRVTVALELMFKDFDIDWSGPDPEKARHWSRELGDPLFDQLDRLHVESHRRLGVPEDRIFDKCAASDSVYGRALRAWTVGRGWEPREPEPCICDTPMEKRPGYAR